MFRKKEKRAKIEENRHLKQITDNNQKCPQFSKSEDDLSLDVSPLLNSILLNDFDWFTIRCVQDYYTEAVKLNQVAGISSYPMTQSIDSTSELFRIPLYISSIRLITFLKQINEFQQLAPEEQVYLVKLNLLTICFFHSIFIYDPRTDSYHEQNTTDPLFSGKDWNKTLNKQFHLKMKQLRNDLIDIFQLDDIIIKLTFLILLFSNQMSLTQSSQCLLINLNSFNIFKAQNVFTDLIYKYCLQQYGPNRTSLLFSRYVHKLLKIQQLVDEMKYSIQNYMETTQLSALMQSLLV